MGTSRIKTLESRGSIPIPGELVRGTQPTFLSTLRGCYDIATRCLSRLVVTDALKVHGYMQLLFEKGISLNIYNESRLCNGDDLGALNGATLLTVAEKPDKLLFSFSNGQRLKIDLCDDAYNGPEALELNIPGQPTVVWN